MNREIRVPRLFDIYKSDFGNNTEDVLAFIYKYLTDPEIDYNTCVEEACVKRSIYILYQ